MRIQSIYIDKFKNLSEFSADLDGSSPVTVVVGRNGAGKSNLLEALTIIFRDLDLGRTPEFGFELRYTCRGSDVLLSNLQNHRRLRIMIDGKRATKAELSGQNQNPRRLPDFVFGYYSGPSNRLATHYVAHQAAFSRALREGDERPLRRLFYAEPSHSQFVLLAFFLSEEPDMVLQNHLGIKEFDSALFVLKEPYWAARSSSSRQGNPRFWRARGAVSDLLDDIWELALAPMRLATDATLADGRRDRSKEHLYLYLRDRAGLVELAQRRYNGNPQELFKAFESILSADLLLEVRVRVKMLGNAGSLVFRELSEGEQQLLMVLGLLRFTSESESLFLLDEPDTHLNPAWSIDYVRLLEESADFDSSASQLVMATHDPLVISGLLKEQVLLLERSGEQTRARHPDEDPRGQGVAGLLTSEIYGLESDLDSITLEKVKLQRLLAARPLLSASEAEKLSGLTRELRDLGFTYSVRDPFELEAERHLTESSQEVSPTIVANDQPDLGAVAETIARAFAEEE